MIESYFGKTFGSFNRRTFLKQSAVTLGGAALALHSGSAWTTSKEPWSPKISENIGSVDDLTLAWLAQLGCEWVVLQGTDWVDKDEKGYWTTDDIEPIQKTLPGVRYGIILIDDSAELVDESSTG